MRRLTRWHATAPDSVYRLYRNPKACDSDDWGRPFGRHATLAEAMAAAGLPDPAIWETDRYCPDECFTRSPRGPQWSILAPGAAAEAVALGARHDPLPALRDGI
jgi:hypothetical protein